MPFPKGMPQWQQDALTQLSQSGQLSNLSPYILGGIEQAETSGWSGGGVNQSGYGGYFGLGPTTYFGNKVTTQELMTGGATSSKKTLASYQAQAKAAAADFAHWFNATGSVTKAETIYQQGGWSGTPSQGVQYVTAAVGSGGAQATDTTATLTSTAGAGTLTGFGSLLQSINNLMNPPVLAANGTSTFNPLMSFLNIITPIFNIANTASTIAGDVTAIVEMLAIRGGFTIAFGVIGYFGLKEFSRSTNSSGIMASFDRHRDSLTKAQNADTRSQSVANMLAIEDAKSDRMMARIQAQTQALAQGERVTSLRSSDLNKRLSDRRADRAHRARESTKRIKHQQKMSDSATERTVMNVANKNRAAKREDLRIVTNAAGEHRKQKDSNVKSTIKKGMEDVAKAAVVAE